jgi:hypothetical protein
MMSTKQNPEHPSITDDNSGFDATHAPAKATRNEKRETSG